jgi:hypothetical protein
LPWIGTVPNAVSLRHLLVGSCVEREPYLLCLARICPGKGQRLAIEVAHRSGLRLVLARKVEVSADAAVAPPAGIALGSLGFALGEVGRRHRLRERSARGGSGTDN